MAFIPWAARGSAINYFDTVIVMNALADSGTPLLNEYSGYFPPHNAQLRRLLADFPTRRGLAVLRAVGARTILVDPAGLAPDQREGFRRALQGGELLWRFDIAGLDVFDLPRSELRPAAGYLPGWRLRAAATADTIEVGAIPTELDGGIYCHVPGDGGLQWEVLLRDERGTERRWRGQPAGPVLLIDGDRTVPTVRIPAGRLRGRIDVVLWEARSGRLLDRTRFTLPRR